MKCLWCGEEIASILFLKRGKKSKSYQACDKDCAHGIDVCEHIDILFHDERKPLLNEKVAYEGGEGVITKFSEKEVRLKLNDDTEIWVERNSIKTLKPFEEEKEDDEEIIVFV